MASTDDFAGDPSTTGTLAPGQPAHGRFDGPGDQDWFKVRLDTGHWYQFSMAEWISAGLALYDANGRLVQTFQFSPATFSWDAGLTPPSSGDYFLAASGNGNEAYTLLMQSRPLQEDGGAPAGSVVALAPGQRASAVLQGPLDSDSFKLSLKAGVTYALDLATAGNSGLQASLEVAEAGHSAHWYLGAGYHSFTPERDGDYTVSVRQQGYVSTQPEQDVPYTLAASLAADDVAANPAGAGRLAVGASASGTLEAGGGDRDWYAVELQAGQTYWFRLQGDASRPGQVQHLELDLRSAAGQWQLASVYADSGFDLPVLAYTPDSSGTYYLDLNNQFGGSGGYRLQALLGTPDDSDSSHPRQLATGSAARGVFEVGGDSDRFQFAALAGHTYEVTVQSAVATALTFTPPEGGVAPPYNAGTIGQRAIATYGSGSDGLATIDLRETAGAAESGYAILVRDAGIDDHPSYPAPGSGHSVLAVGASVHGVLEASQDEDPFTVQVEQGKNYVFELSGAASGGGSLDAAGSQHLLLLQNGVPLGTADLSAAEARLSYQAGASGELTVYVVGGVANTGSYTLSAQRLDGPAPTLAAGPAAAIGVERGLSLKFSESVQLAEGKLHLRDASGAELALAAHAVHDTLLVDPAALLRPGQAYRLELEPGAVRDLAGNPYQGPSSFSFSTLPAAGAAAGGDDLLALHSGALDGGAGTDTVLLDGARSAYSVSRANGQLTLAARDGGASVVLSNVERVWFADQAVAFDSHGSGGEVYRLYQAAFNRAPDVVGLGFWTYQHDHGMSLDAIAAQFLASAEFSDRYGMAPTNAQFVDQLYQNVLHRAGEPGGVAHWNKVLDGGYARAGVLAAFSESPENVALLAPVVDAGFSYAPWAY